MAVELHEGPGVVEVAVVWCADRAEESMTSILCEIFPGSSIAARQVEVVAPIVLLKLLQVASMHHALARADWSERAVEHQPVGASRQPFGRRSASNAP